MTQQVSGLSYGGWTLDAARAYEFKQVRIRRALDRLYNTPGLGFRGQEELRSAIQLEALTERNWEEFWAVWRDLVPAKVPNSRDLYELKELLLLGRSSPAEVRELMGAVVDVRPWYGR